MHIFARSKSFQLVRKVNTLSICLASYRESHRRYKRATLNRFKCMVRQGNVTILVSHNITKPQDFGIDSLDTKFINCPLIIEKLANVDAVVQTYIS